MTKPTSEPFQPDWASPPGESISDILKERNISLNSFGNLLDFTHDETLNLMVGRTTITIDIARRLATVLGSSVEFWMTRDYQYRQDAKRLQENEELWLNRLPLEDMIKFGWLDPPPLPADELTSCLEFFEVRTIREWQRTYSGLSEMAVFRTSPSFESRHEAVAAWLRQGEKEAARIECQEWDPSGFEKSLESLRELTRRKNPAEFMPILQNLCARYGVAVVAVRSPNGCRASGATRFTADKKAILQFSFRYLVDDQFWFTFFHECGHLLLHGSKYYLQAEADTQKSWILEDIDDQNPEEENEANRFAFDTLIPQNFQRELRELPINRRNIIRFAYRVGVSSGIVVGQLQKSGRIGFNQFNNLKRRYTWTD